MDQEARRKKVIEAIKEVLEGNENPDSVMHQIIKDELLRITIRDELALMIQDDSWKMKIRQVIVHGCDINGN